MIHKQNDATPNRPEGSRPLDADTIYHSLTDRLAQLKREPAWQDRDRTAITLVHHPRLRVVLLALHKDALMETHTADGPVTIQVLEGRLAIEMNAQSYELQPGELLVIDDQIPHSVQALDEAAFLLTMGPGPAKTF
jgi:quercetin dioxygenase-like cupin family protein